MLLYSKSFYFFARGENDFEVERNYLKFIVEHILTKFSELLNVANFLANVLFFCCYFYFLHVLYLFRVCPTYTQFNMSNSHPIVFCLPLL